jgi:hypothetical protein
MGEGEVITDAEVVSWASELPVPLSADDVRELVSALNLMRVTVHVKDVKLPFHLKQAHQRIEKSILELTQDLPKLIEAYRKFGTERAVTSVQVFEDLLSAGRRADEYVRHARAPWGGAAAPKYTSAPWHGDAIYLVWILRLAAGRAGKPLSFTKGETPAVAFIDTALTRAGVEHGGLESIARAMSRYKAKMKCSRAALPTKSKVTVTLNRG